MVLLVAVILIAVLGSLPGVSLALYPVSLFVTLIHESWHAIVTLATGGSVTSLQVSSDLSGQVLSVGGSEPLIASAGYLGAAATGAAVLAIPLRWARGVIAALAVLPLAVLTLFHPASTFTAVWCLVFAILLGVAAWRLPARWLALLQIFLGAAIGLNALRDVSTLVLISGSGGHMQTDATNMGHSLFGPPILWSVVWSVSAVLLIAAALVHVARSDLRRLGRQG
jgi:hypothetical protein